ncbi:MAG: hypothetical protein ACK4UU_03025, partial [Fimbriimonadales bacterium]
MATPYTTKSGLQIGLLYQPPQRPHHDTDALRLQRALLSANDHASAWRADPDGVFIAVFIALAMLALFAAGPDIW